MPKPGPANGEYGSVLSALPGRSRKQEASPGQRDHWATPPGAHRYLPHADPALARIGAAETLQPDVAGRGRRSEERRAPQHPRLAHQVVADGHGAAADIDQPPADSHQIRLEVPGRERWLVPPRELSGGQVVQVCRRSVVRAENWIADRPHQHSGGHAARDRAGKCRPADSGSGGLGPWMAHPPRPGWQRDAGHHPARARQHRRHSQADHELAAALPPPCLPDHGLRHRRRLRAGQHVLAPLLYETCSMISASSCG